MSSLSVNQSSILAPDAYSLSFARSNLGKFTAGVVVVSAVTVAIGLTCTPLIASIATVSAVSGVIFAAIGMRHRLIYDISLIFTSWKKLDWWNPISKDVILGAIPHEHHIPHLKALGVTHVITMLEDFELEPGIIRPASKDQWKAQDIRRYHAKAADFKGVPPKMIARVLKEMRHVRKKNRKAKFYIHCKAGRGRSATIAVLDRIMEKHRKGQITLSKQDPAKLIAKEIERVKRHRPQINLNPRQRATMIEFLERQRGLI